MKLLVGLGNPGARYQNTRHNVGFMVLDALAAEWGVRIEKKRGTSLVGKALCEGEKILLLKPQTYMNRSGEAVLEALHYYRDAIDDLLVIHDDLDLEVGRLRFKRNGGAGGHNGLKSIMQMLNSADFDRLKIGIGRPHGAWQTEDYVLGGFDPEEKAVITEVIAEAAQGVKLWCLQGIDEAMNKHNSFQVSLKKEKEEQQ